MERMELGSFFSTCFVSDILLATLYILSHVILIAAF